MRLKSCAVLFALLFTSTVAVIGCDDGGRLALEEDDEAQASADEGEQEPARVDLPSPPPDEAFDIPERNDDGTLRVEGLIHHQSDHLGEEVEVKGVVTDILGDCDPSVAKRRGEPCPQPHYIIKDEEGSNKQLMVVGFHRSFFNKAGVRKGDTETFKGNYTKSWGQFVNSESGLIELKEVGQTKVAGK